MIPVTCFSGKKLALFGLGTSGLATAAALVAGGADLLVFDDDAGALLRAQELGLAIVDFHELEWHDLAAFVLAPGVPLTHPEPHWTVQLARSHGVEIIGDIELFVRERKVFLQNLQKNQSEEQDFHLCCPFIAITGTNGKSTTTALIAHILKLAGYDVQIGGNIGTAVLALEPFTDKRCYVVECSSYQIDLAPSLDPTIGILLNLTADHLDRHGSFEHYASVKQRLLEHASYILMSGDDEPCRKLYQNLYYQGKRPVVFSASHRLKEGYFGLGQQLFYAENGLNKQLAVVHSPSLRGRHNCQNALAALASCHILGVSSDQVNSAFLSFEGLPHRMQEIRQKGHVLFVNDSKATNAESVAPALASFDHIYWIIGGVAKAGGISSLRPFFPKIKKAYLIGDAAEEFAVMIGNEIAITLSATLENAVYQAAQDAALDKDGQVVVLLSPACSSFDQFANYVERGEKFCQLVQKL